MANKNIKEVEGGEVTTLNDSDGFELDTGSVSSWIQASNLATQMLKRVTSQTANTTPATTDELAMVDDPGGTPAAQKITFANFLKVINGLTEDTAPVRSTDYIVTYDASAGAARKVLISKAAPKIYQVFASTTNPADASTYYFGGLGAALTTGASLESRLYFHFSGTITAIRLQVFCTAGTTEQSTVSFRLNGATDTTITATLDLSNNRIISTTGLSIAVVSGDYFNIKWVTPTWATNPTNVTFVGTIFVE